MNAKTYNLRVDEVTFRKVDKIAKKTQLNKTKILARIVKNQKEFQ